jgi:hypothetical protein
MSELGEPTWYPGLTVRSVHRIVLCNLRHHQGRKSIKVWIVAKGDADRRQRTSLRRGGTGIVHPTIAIALFFLCFTDWCEIETMKIEIMLLYIAGWFVASLESFLIQSPLRHSVAHRRRQHAPIFVRRTHAPFTQMEDTDGSTSLPFEEGSELTFNRQLWLDLRETAIRPAEALTFLDEFLLGVNSEDELATTEMKYVVDRIIVPEETYRDLPENSPCSVDLLVVENGVTLVPVDGATATQPKPKGTFIRPGDSLLNPLESLEIYNRGDWIVFDSTGLQGDDISAWIDEVGSLLQLLPVAASPQSLEALSGLMLPSDTVTSKTGGVGIFCSTREALFRADTLLEQILSGAGSTESFESGILLLASPDEDGTSPSITSALVLPLDLDIWRSVLEMRTTT